MSDAALISRRLALLYRLDADGRLLASNEPCGPGQAAPLAHICLGRSTVAYALRSGLPRVQAQQLSVAMESLQPSSDLGDRRGDDRIWDSVRSVPGVGALSSGPVFGFPPGLDLIAGVVLVEPSNAGSLGVARRLGLRQFAVDVKIE